MQLSSISRMPYLLAQVGERLGLQLVEIVSHQQGNLYDARAVEFDASRNPAYVDDDTLTVLNLAEPADSGGNIPDGTHAVAIDVEGYWIVFLRDSEGSAGFPARILSASGGAVYQVREQVVTGVDTFSDKPAAVNVSACNLAELSLGPGAALEDDTIVWLTCLPDATDASQTRYVFDHPAYAKYLD